MSDKMMNDRRFTGTRTLYQSAFDHFCHAHVYVIGVGGVGSWAAEGLARTGIGTLTLVDLDVLVESNINRQLPALTDTFGESKIDVMAKRVLAINPDIVVHRIDDFLTAENVTDILPDKETVKQLASQGVAVVVLDCTDDMNAKLAISLHCRFNKIKFVVSGGAGGKIDPTKIKVADLKEVSYDPLLAQLRTKLRQKNINKHSNAKFNIRCVYSTEALKMATVCQSGLNCGGYGSAVAVTSVVGMVMVAECLKIIQSSHSNKNIGDGV